MKKEVLRFSGELIGTSSKQRLHINFHVIRSGTRLQEEHKGNLLQPITEKEIWEALKGIQDNKAQ